MSTGSGRREGVLGRDRSDGRRRGVEEWRGVAAEHNDEVAERASGLLKRRSRALLADLLDALVDKLVHKCRIGCES